MRTKIRMIINRKCHKNGNSDSGTTHTLHQQCWSTRANLRFRINFSEKSDEKKKMNEILVNGVQLKRCNQKHWLLFRMHNANTTFMSFLDADRVGVKGTMYVRLAPCKTGNAGPYNVIEQCILMCIYRFLWFTIIASINMKTFDRCRDKESSNDSFWPAAPQLHRQNSFAWVPVGNYISPKITISCGVSSQWTAVPDGLPPFYQSNIKYGMIHDGVLYSENCLWEETLHFTL